MIFKFPTIHDLGKELEQDVSLIKRQIGVLSLLEHDLDQIQTTRFSHDVTSLVPWVGVVVLAESDEVFPDLDVEIEIVDLFEFKIIGRFNFGSYPFDNKLQSRLILVYE